MTTTTTVDTMAMNNMSSMSSMNDADSAGPFSSAVFDPSSPYAIGDD